MFLCFVCLCWGAGWVMTVVVETDGGVRFGKGRGWKAGWQASACLDSFSVPSPENDKEGAGWGRSVCGGRTERGSAGLQAERLPSSIAMPCSVEEAGAEGRRQIMQSWELGAPTIFYRVFVISTTLSLVSLMGVVRKAIGNSNKPIQAWCKLNSVEKLSYFSIQTSFLFINERNSAVASKAPSASLHNNRLMWKNSSHTLSVTYSGPFLRASGSGKVAEVGCSLDLGRLQQKLFCTRQLLVLCDSDKYITCILSPLTPSSSFES